MMKVRSLQHQKWKAQHAKQKNWRGVGLNKYPIGRLPEHIPVYHRVAQRGIRSIHWWSQHRDHLL